MVYFTSNETFNNTTNIFVFSKLYLFKTLFNIMIPFEFGVCGRVLKFIEVMTSNPTQVCLS